jgi:hypothetical protein
MTRFIPVLLAVSLLSACAAKQNSATPIDAKPAAVTSEVASKYVLYAMLSANSYHKRDRIHFPVEMLGWEQVDDDKELTPTTKPAYSNGFTGLAYDVYRNTDNRVIVAYRGTDSKWDYAMSNVALGVSIPYKSAKKKLTELIDLHPDKKVAVTGHSLGGGLALSMSTHQGVEAYTFDASPRVFDGLGDHQKPATRVLVFQDGEILEKFRDKWWKMKEVLKDPDVYAADYEFRCLSFHRGDLLALGLLKQAAEKDAKFQPVLNAVLQQKPAQEYEARTQRDGQCPDKKKARKHAADVTATTQPSPS